VKDYVAEATNRLCAETGEADGSTARDSVATGFNATWVCTVLAHTHTDVLRLFFWEYPSEPVQEEIFFWTLWCKGRQQM